MTDPKLIADRYIALWNETDPAVRRRLLAEDWLEQASYVDPMMAGRGVADIDALIAGVQKQFPNYSFRLTGKPDGHGENIRFSWALGLEGGEPLARGTDFALLAADGRLRSVTGFLDQMPMA